MGTAQRGSRKSKRAQGDGSPALVSLDVGKGYTKGRADAGFIMFPSVVGDVYVADDLGDLFGDEDYIISFDGQQLAIGDTVYRKGSTNRQVQHITQVDTPLYKALFISAIHKLVKPSPEVLTPVDLVVSVPFNYYGQRQRFKENMTGQYNLYVYEQKEWRSYFYNIVMQNFDEEGKEYNSFRVIPEGLGAVCGLALTKDGNDAPGSRLAKKTVGVVDVGTVTTDMINLDNMRLIEGRCYSDSGALKNIHDKLLAFGKQHGVTLERYRCPEIIRLGYFTKAGKRIMLEKHMDRWSDELAQGIEGNIRDRWNGGDDVEEILLTGGGASYVHPYLQGVFQHVRLASDNLNDLVMCNADGGYNYGKMQRLHGAK